MYKKFKNQPYVPKKQKTHDMNTRKPNTYQVQNAVSERLKNSPLIFMQNHLNSERKA